MMTRSGESNYGDAPDAAHRLDLEKSRENEERFAAANAKIKERALSLEINRNLIPFLCECSDVRCTQIIQLSIDSYEAAKARPAAFLLVAGHDDSRVERIIARTDGYVLVEKFS
jgi:hypothetical protein